MEQTDFQAEPEADAQCPGLVGGGLGQLARPLLDNGRDPVCLHPGSSRTPKAGMDGPPKAQGGRVFEERGQVYTSPIPLSGVLCLLADGFLSISRPSGIRMVTRDHWQDVLGPSRSASRANIYWPRSLTYCLVFVPWMGMHDGHMGESPVLFDGGFWPHVTWMGLSKKAQGQVYMPTLLGNFTTKRLKNIPN